MSGAAVFGVWGAVAYFVLIQAAPQPAGAIVYWTSNAALLAWGSTLCWRRMRLPYAAASMAVVAAASAMCVGLAVAGHVVPALPVAGWVAFGISLAVSGVLFLIESRVNRDRWRQWKAYAADKTAWETIRGHHIPTLHTSARTNAARSIERG